MSYVVSHASVRSRFSLGRAPVMFGLFILIAVLSIMFMANFHNSATRGYQVTRLEEERDDLLNSREQKNLDLSRSQSLDFIKESAVVSGMVPVNYVEYYKGQVAVGYRE